MDRSKSVGKSGHAEELDIKTRSSFEQTLILCGQHKYRWPCKLMNDPLPAHLRLEFFEQAVYLLIAITNRLFESGKQHTVISLELYQIPLVPPPVGVSTNLNPPSTSRMSHAKTVNRSRIIIANFLLLGVKSYALPDDGLVGLARCAPYCKGHLKAHDQGAFGL